jgi:multiple sugar transport system ATP-binding protein
MYARPANIFVAGFIGSPAMNFFSTTLERDGEGFTVRLGEVALPVAIAPEYGARLAGAPGIAGLRPEHLGLDVEGRTVPFEVTPTLVESLGAERYLHFPAPAENAVRWSAGGDAQDGANGRMIARVLGETRARAGEKVRLAVDPTKLHLFEPDSEKAIH